jgi:hypothetical protein
MGFLDDIRGIKENRGILFLLGGGALLLIIILLLPTGERREVELPPGFERVEVTEVPLTVPAVAVAPTPAPVADEVFLSPLILEEAQRRHTREWGIDPFLTVATEEGAEHVNLHLEAIFLGAKRSAIINGEILTIGDKILGFQVTDIAEGAVTLEREGLIRRLSFW